MPIPALIGAVGGAFSSAIGGLFGKSNADKSLAAQREENEKNRQHNLKLAELQNKWNMEMYDKNNKYNSPSEQRKRLAAAGVNPDLFYGGSGSLTPAVAPNLTAGEGSHSSVTPGYAPYDVAGVISSGFDNAVKAAQVGLIRAQTKKTEGESNIVWSDARVRDAVNQGQLELNGAQIRLADSQVKLNEEQAKKIAPEINNINASTELMQSETDKVKAEISSINQDVVYKKIQNYFAGDMFRKQIDKLSSETDLNKAKCREILELLVYKKLDLQADIKLKASQEYVNYSTGDLNLAHELNMRVTNDILDFNLSQLKSYDDLERWVHIIGSIASAYNGTLSNIRGAVATALTAGM